MEKVKILNTVEIINNSVSIYDGKRPFLSTGDLDVSMISKLEYLTYDEKPSRANLNVQIGDLIMARMQGTCKVKIIKKEEQNIIVSTGFLVLRKKENIHNKYLFHLLKSDFFQKEKDKLCTGATQKAINNENFAKLQLPLPSLSEQKKIADKLDQADKIRQQSRQLIEKYEALSQSLFLEMFGDPVKNEKRWEKKSGEEYSNKISVGVVIKPASNYVDKGVIALRSLNVKPNKIDLTDLVYFSEKAHNNELSKSKLHKGDVVIIRTGSTGTAAIIPEELDNINCIDLIIVKPNLKLINPKYLVYFFNSERGKNLVSGHEVGGIQKHFNIGSIKKIEIPTPPISLQNQFAQRITKIEQQKQFAQQELEKSEALFQSLLQQSFR